MLRLTDEGLKSRFAEKFNAMFDSLKNKLSSEKNIAIINGITTESENLKENFINEIDNSIIIISDPPVDDPPVSPDITEKDIDIKKIALSTKVKFESEEKIDEFIEKLKSKLKEELKGVDIINLKLWGHIMVEIITKCLNEWNATIEALGQGKQSI